VARVEMPQSQDSTVKELMVHKDSTVLVHHQPLGSTVKGLMGHEDSTVLGASSTSWQYCQEADGA